MASQLDSTTRLGQAFTADRTAVFASIQRLRKQAQRRRDAEDHAAAGSRDADDVDRPAGDRHRAGEPAGHVRAAIQPADGLRQPATTVVVQEQQRGCGRRGLIGFTAGIAIGAA